MVVMGIDIYDAIYFKNIKFRALYMNITELLPWINLLLGVGLVPLVKTLFEINKNLDAINTTVQLLDKDVKYKVSELAKEIDSIKERLKQHDEHIWTCNNVMKSHLLNNKGE